MKMKKQTFLIIAVFFVILVGGFLVVKERSWWKEEILPTPTPTVALPPIEESVEIDLLPRDDKRAVILKISRIPEGVKTVEYEITYEAKSGLPKGVIGKIELKEKEDSISREIVLGTCSRNVCVYDEGVGKISLALVFTGDKGSQSFKKDYEL